MIESERTCPSKGRVDDWRCDCSSLLPRVLPFAHARLQIFAPFDPELPPSYCTVFTHLVKSGGSSIKGQLREESRKLGLPKPGKCSWSGFFPRWFTPEQQSSDVGRVNRPSLPSRGRVCSSFGIELMLRVWSYMQLACWPRWSSFFAVKGVEGDLSRTERVSPRKSLVE